MTCRSDQFFPNTTPTQWKKPTFPNQSNRLQNRVWRKQQK